MGKASSNKKVARAAKAGGGRARAAGERNLLFPAALALVVVLGTLLVVYARENRSAEALEPPLAFDDHWHSAYGFFVCDEYLPQLPEFTAPQNGGTHTHGDGLIHIHPFSTARSGENATLQNWLLDAGAALGGGDAIDEDSLGVPGGETYTEGEDTCEGVEGDPIVQVRFWDSAQAALDGADPAIITENFDTLRFRNDGEVYVLAFAPEDADIPVPPSISDLEGVGSDLGVDPEEIEVPEGEDLEDIDGDGTTDTTGSEPDTTEGDSDTTATTAGDS